MTATPPPAPAPAPAAPGTDQVEITEAHLRSLSMDDLAQLLDSQGVRVPESVPLNSTAIVDWVIAEFGA